MLQSEVLKTVALILLLGPVDQVLGETPLDGASPVATRTQSIRPTVGKTCALRQNDASCSDEAWLKRQALRPIVSMSESAVKVFYEDVCATNVPPVGEMWTVLESLYIYFFA